MQHTIAVPQADPVPPPPRTGVAVEGCYASSLSDCGGELEAEHFISHRMLKGLADERGMIFVRGIAPQGKKNDEENAAWVPAKKLTALVLCARHNRAAKPIDSAGSRFLETVQGVRDMLAENEKDLVIAVNGRDIERWCLKALCGFLARAGKPVPELWARVLFGRNELNHPRGLYVYAGVGDELSGPEMIQLTEIREGETTVGVHAQILIHELAFSMHASRPEGVPTEAHAGKACLFRPECFVFARSDREAKVLLWLSWNDNHFHDTVEITLS